MILAKGSPGVEETDRGDGGAEGTDRQFLFHRQINQVRANLFPAKVFGFSKWRATIET
jgi:hypothetical protein